MKKKINILIAPASYDGRKIFRKFNHDKKYNIKGFIDNDIKKKYLYKKKVNHISTIQNLEYDKIITGGRYFKELYSALKKKNISDDKIIILPKRKFDFSKKELALRTVNTEKILVQLLKIIKIHKMNYFLDASSILAVIRKVSLAKFSDVDILLDSQHGNFFLKKIANIKNIIIKKDQINFKGEKILKRVILFSRKKSSYEEPSVFDIAFFWEDKVGIYKYFVNKKTYLPNNIFKNSLEMKYKNFYVKLPKNYHKYMKILYGNNWKKPNDYFQEKIHFKGLFKKTFFKNFYEKQN